jgi:hypothetical protein
MYLTANVEVTVPTNGYTVGEVASMLDVPRHRIVSLFQGRRLPEPPRMGPTNYRFIPASWIPMIRNLLATSGRGRAGRPVLKADLAAFEK